MPSSAMTSGELIRRNKSAEFNPSGCRGQFTVCRPSRLTENQGILERAYNLHMATWFSPYTAEAFAVTER